MSTSNPRGATVMIISVVFQGLATVCIFTRVYARLVILRNSGWDEVAIIASFLCSVGLLVFTEAQVRHGEGKHFQDVIANNPQDFTDQLKFLWISIIFYQASLSLTKVAIILQYLRVFVGKEIRRACWASLAIVTAYGIYTFLISVFNCIPISAFWSPTPDMHCINKKFSWFFNASVNILTDIIIILLPIQTLKSLQLPTRQKIGLMVIFALGGFVCLVSVLRLQSLYVISVSSDPTFDNVGASIWSNIEVYTGIICASLPAIKPVIGKFFPNLLLSNRNGLKRTTLGNGFGTSNNGRPIRLHDVDNSNKTLTRVEADKRSTSTSRGSNDSGDPGRDIFVTTSVKQDLEGRLKSMSQYGSEEGFDFQLR